MKIWLFNAKGDELLAECSSVAEAEKILKEYQNKGCSVITERSDIITELKDPLPDEVWILWPMAGGCL